MKLFYAVSFALLSSVFQICHADENSYKITYVYDGDTVKLSHADGEFKLRLADIDAPERNQSYGLKSRRALSKLCLGNKISLKVTISDTDKYMRTLGKLECNKIDASLYLVNQGLAWHYTQYSNDPALHDAELKARKQKRGLWATASPTPPWIWRRQQQEK